MPAIICGWEYFPNNRGFVNGMIVGGFGFGSFFFGFISTALINPDNEKSQEIVNGTVTDHIFHWHIA
jgi:hypothetical protein